MPKYANGFYQILNADKYVGKKVPHFRSSWEHSFMRFCDENPAVLQWASEAIHIPYQNPFTSKQTTLEAAGRSMRDQAAAVLNAYKWQAAQAWCSQNGLRFRVLTENDIFHQGKAR